MLTTIIQGICDSGNYSDLDHQGRLRGENSVKLWLWARFHDLQGSGKAEISCKRTLEFFNISPRTYRRWLIDGVALGFLRSFRRISKDVVQMYYSSPEKLACRLGVGDLGAIAKAPIETIRNLRQTCTKIAALALQSASQHSQRSKKACGRLLNPDEVLRPSGIAAGVRLFATSRYLVVGRNVQLVGGSQASIAVRRGRHEATINRHLKTLGPLEKKQIAVADRFNAIEMMRNRLEHRQQLRLFYLEGFDLPLKAHCCIYSFPEIELISKRNLRYRVKRVATATGLIRKTYQYKCQLSAAAGGGQAAKRDKKFLSDLPGGEQM